MHEKNELKHIQQFKKKIVLSEYYIIQIYTKQYSQKYKENN